MHRLNIKYELNRLKAGLICILLFLLLATLFQPVTVLKAQSSEIMPSDQAIIYTAYRFIDACLDINSKGVLDKLVRMREGRDESELSSGRVFTRRSGQASSSNTRAGWLVQEGSMPSNNGYVECTGEDPGRYLRAAGIDPLVFFTEATGLYESSQSQYNLTTNDRSTQRDRIKSGFQSLYTNINFESNMTASMQHFSLMPSFVAKCARNTVTSGGEVLRIVDPQTGQITETRYHINTSDDEHSIPWGITSAGASTEDSNRGNKAKCADIIRRINETADAASRETMALNDRGVVTTYRTSDPEQEQDNSCETNSGVLGWIMCPVAGVLDSIVGFLDEQIRGQLHLREDYFRDNGNGNPVKESWTQLRNIAYVILVPIMLVMVIGTALGFEVFSAYTIQKALPRMAIAVIFIALSWYICLFMVDLFNVMGAGIKGLITGPFSISNDQSPLKAALTSAEVISQGSNTLESISSGITTGGLAVVGTVAAWSAGALSIGVIMSTLATAALVLGGVFLLLVARQIILIALFLLAPLAILSWIFPGNDKMWKLWWGSFSKLLMLFPLIMLLLGVGEVFAHITGAARSAAGQDKLVTTVIVIGSFIMPFFFIPFAFKWAGGVFGNLAGMVNDRERGMLDKLRKGRSESRSQGWQRFKTGTGTGFAQRNRIARGVGTRLGAGVGGGKGVFGFGEKGRARMDQMNRQNAIDQIMKNPAWNGVNQDDNALHAGILMEDMSKQEAIAALVQQRGLSQAEAERAAAAWGASGLGGRAAAIAAAQQLVSTGTGYNNLSDMTKTLARASGGNASTATALAGFANAETKKVGRNDLAPGFSTANSLTQGWLDEGGRLRETNTASKASWTEAHDQTWRSGSLYQLANGKPKQMEAFADHWTKEYEDSVRLGDSERAVVASRALEEMREMQSNATGENSEIIRRALERREAFDGSYAQNQGNAAQQTTGSPNTPGGTAAGYQSEEAASQYIADIKTRSRQGARVYQRPDPNNMT